MLVPVMLFLIEEPTGAAGSQTFIPIAISAFPGGVKNRVRITFNQFTGIASRQTSIFAVNRSIEILSCCLNSWDNASNFDSWNVITYPNVNSTASTNFGTGTQNMPTYLEPVSTTY
jgi:hypothetical protein